MGRLIKAFLIVMFLASPTYAAINILPLGDSITINVQTKSYRFYLWKLLTSKGYNVDFIGTQRYQQYDNFDPDHEGHAGWRADQIAVSLGGWLNSYTPDIVLLHIGHNDFFQGESVANVINDINNIINKLQADNPRVTILLAQIIYPNWNQKKWTELNAQIPGLAAGKTTIQSLVMPVNQNEYFNPATDTYDGAHPNDSGDQKIAQQWFNAIVRTMVLAPPVLRIVPETK